MTVAQARSSVSPTSLGAPRSAWVTEQTTLARTADRFAALLGTVCDRGDVALAHAVTVRRAQQAAWAELCASGWSSWCSADMVDPVLATTWLQVWTQYRALPSHAASSRDLARQRRMLRQLHRYEADLRAELPADVWNRLAPMDDAGRARLAAVLDAFAAWSAAAARSAVATHVKKNLRICLALLGHQARQMGLATPEAPLDLDGWRTVVAAAHGKGNEARARSGRVSLLPRTRRIDQCP